MPRCLKRPYPDQRSAERALLAVQLKSRDLGRKVPTGSYWCGECKSWHLTSQTGSRPAPWNRPRPTP
jgi:hypothetical protein